MDCSCGFKMNIININKNIYYKCDNCNYLKKKDILSNDLQKERYDFHICDEKYISYMRRIYNDIKEYVIGKKVLDFGCGKIHALSDILKEEGYESDYYDLFYYPKFPHDMYDSIIMIEVFEHLENPFAEIVKLKKYLNKNGRLIIQTKFYPDKLDNWWYLRDTTHISFVKENTIIKWCDLLNMKLKFVKGDIFVLESID